jgi:hypothetical protein
MPYFSEDPLPELPDMYVCLLDSSRMTLMTECRLSTVKGEWHEYESKRARKKARDEAS